MSTADMAAALLTGEAAYSAAMGAGVAEKSARDLWEQGEDNDTINTVSTAAGIAEMFFEKFSAENLWKAFDYAGTKDGSKLVLKWLHNMARQGIVEASEETLTEAANMIVDYAARGDRSDVKSWEDVGTRLYKSAVGGAIGGLLGGGMATTAGAATQGSDIHQYHNYEKQAGQGIVSNANVEALIEKARQTGDDSLVAQADALEKLYQSDNVSEKKLKKEAGKLYASMQESTIKNVDEATAKRAEIKRAFAEQLRGNEAIADVEKASEALTKDYFSDKLTRSEKAIVATGVAQEAKAAVKENEDILTEQAQKSQQRAYEDYIGTYALTQDQEKPKESAIDTSDYHQSADGATYYDGDFVNVKDIASVGADSVTVNLDNGKTADVKKMDLSSEDDAVIYQSIVDIQKSLGQPISRELANEIYHGYDSDVYQNATDYILGVRDAIEKGYSNESLMKSDDPAAVLAPAAREEFYRAGRNIALGNTAQRQSNVTAQPSATGKGSVTFEGGDIKKVLPRLNGRRRVAVDLMTGLAKAKGLDVVFFESKKDGKGRWNSKYANAQTGDTGAQSPNGFYKNGKIYIDINSGTNGQGLILFTASHELVHMIREYSPEMYQELADFLVEKYNQKGISVRTLVLREMAKSTNLNYDEALEEVIANSCESFLCDVHLNDKAAELYRSKPTLANKIRDYLHDLLSRLKKWYAGLTPQSVEGRTVAAMRDEIQHVHDLFIQGINQASKNRLNVAASEGVSDENEQTGNVKLQSRDEDFDL
ncbi:hypothetical protein, partial [Ruminococcus sp.]|uniref:hypothetical protein n=1 Tax=Ruminococcus sp. TaxID=41978 RepID=UPI00388D0300